MKSSWKIFIIIACVVSIGALAGIFYWSKPDLSNQDISKAISLNGSVAGTNSNQGTDYLERLAKFMNDQGMVIYGSYQSSETKSQKDLFGNSSQFLNYVECDATGPSANPDECLSQSVNVYPTWIYNGQKYVGDQSLSKLASYVGFSE